VRFDSLSSTIREAGPTMRGSHRIPERPARRRGGLVRWIGRLPFQGRQGTLRLITVCHTAAGAAAAPESRRAAWAMLRHAAAMNVVRHGVPLPFGPLAMLGYQRLAAAAGCRLWDGPLVLCGALTVADTMAFYAQANIHLHLAGRLAGRGGRSSGRARPRAAGVAAGVEFRPSEAPDRVFRRDRLVTRVLVLVAVVVVPPGASWELVNLVGPGR
jgi:hypothetical protein